jgi:NADP oxidoreductase coenzyme F420-dependent
VNFAQRVLGEPDIEKAPMFSAIAHLPLHICADVKVRRFICPIVPRYIFHTRANKSCVRLFAPFYCPHAPLNAKRTGQEVDRMQIAIIGAGKIGATVGHLWARAGHKMRFSTRHPDELRDLAKGDRRERIHQHEQGSGPVRRSGFRRRALWRMAGTRS